MPLHGVLAFFESKNANLSIILFKRNIFRTVCTHNMKMMYISYFCISCISGFTGTPKIADWILAFFDQNIDIEYSCWKLPKTQNCGILLLLSNVNDTQMNSNII